MSKAENPLVSKQKGYSSQRPNCVSQSKLSGVKG
jgi:hypothetical protein